jgi:hypothetical protein
MVSPSLRDRAERRVGEARRIIARQRQFIADLKACNGHYPQEAELMTRFEQSLAIFEADLAAFDDANALASRAV